MRMKHRWTGGLLVAAALTLGACAPTDPGADDPATEVTDATDAPTSAPDDGTPAPADYEQDEY
jgi:hypothetical protein